MHIGYIDSDSYPYYSPFLLPQAAEALKNKKYITALGISDSDTACGAVTGYLSDYSFHILSLYISPDYRRKGYGKALLEKLQNILTSHSLATSFTVSFTVTDDDHSPLIPFLASLQFLAEQDEKTLYTFLLSDVASSLLSDSENKTKQNDDILPFSAIPDSTLLLAEKLAKNDDALLPLTSLTDPSINKDISFALVNKGLINAFVVFDNSCGNMVTLSCVWTNRPSPSVLFALLRAAYTKANTLYTPDTKMAIQAVNHASASLIQSLIPDARPFSFTYRKEFNINRI